MTLRMWGSNMKAYTFCNSIKKSITCIGMFLKVALVEILRNFFLTQVVSLQSTGCIATKTKLLVRFFQGFFENFRKHPGRAL